MRIAGLVHTGASMAVICAFAVRSCHSMSLAPALFLVLLLSPARVQVLEMALPFIVVSLRVDLWVNFSDTECSRAKFDSFWCLRAASLSHVIEVLAAHFHVLDPEAVTVLPSGLDLVVAQPCLAIEGALLVFLVQRCDVIPAGVESRFSLDALV